MNLWVRKGVAWGITILMYTNHSSYSRGVRVGPEHAQQVTIAERLMRAENVEVPIRFDENAC